MAYAYTEAALAPISRALISVLSDTDQSVVTDELHGCWVKIRGGVGEIAVFFPLTPSPTRGSYSIVLGGSSLDANTNFSFTRSEVDLQPAILVQPRASATSEADTGSGLRIGLFLLQQKGFYLKSRCIFATRLFYVTRVPWLLL